MHSAFVLADEVTGPPRHSGGRGSKQGDEAPVDAHLRGTRSSLMQAILQNLLPSRRQLHQRQGHAEDVSSKGIFTETAQITPIDRLLRVEDSEILSRVE